MKPSKTMETKASRPDSTFSVRMALRRMLPRMSINILLPLIIYRVVIHFGPASDLLAITVAALPPLLNTLITYFYKRRIDVMGVLIVAGFALVFVMVFITGDARFVSLRQAMMHAFFGIICLVSLVLSKPLALTVYKYLRTGGGAAHSFSLDRQLQDEAVLFTSTLVTLVIGIALIILALVHVFLVFFLSAKLFSLVASLISISVDGVLFVWAVRSMRSALHHAHATQPATS